MPDRVLDALANRQRRRLLATLLEHVPDGHEESLAFDAVPTEQLRGVSSVELYHVHLPKLADTGVLEWDRETDRIAAGPRLDDARQVLRLACGRQDGASAD